MHSPLEQTFGLPITVQELRKRVPGIFNLTIAEGMAFLVQLLKKFGIQSSFTLADSTLALDSRFSELSKIVQSLRKVGVLQALDEHKRIPDEPHFFYYSATLSNGKPASGTSFFNRMDACFAAVAEATERYIWEEDEEFAGVPIRASYAEIGADKAFRPQGFVGFSNETKKKLTEVDVTDETQLNWIPAYSYTQRRTLFIPAQLASLAYAKKGHKEHKEKIVRIPITTGLSTAPSSEEALVKGILECMERDAFITHYLNNITPPKLYIDLLAEDDEDVAVILARLKRYKLTPHVLYLTTDIPAHAVCTVLVDDSDEGPAISLGMRTSFNLKQAVMDSIKEALFLRPTIRSKKGETYPSKFADFTMMNRGVYWSKQEHRHQLDFFISGNYVAKTFPSYEEINWKLKLAELTAWFKEKRFELLAMDLTKSKYNKTPWHVVMAICPELHPMHLLEKYRYDWSPRLDEIPKLFGKEVPKERNIIPHPFL